MRKDDSDNTNQNDSEEESDVSINDIKQAKSRDYS